MSFMDKEECSEFLQWCLPRLRMRWAGFRKVRKQVCKRLSRRLEELGLPDLTAYKSYLDIHPQEWQNLDRLCRITISRFYRDREVFDTLRIEILPFLATEPFPAGEAAIRCWSAGCCSGEEPYTLQLIWFLSLLPQIPAKLSLQITATDSETSLLDRARKGCYSKGCLKELPRDWIGEAFYSIGEEYCIRREFAEDILFVQQDIHEEMPDGFFHLILCRNLVFTYFESSLQQEILQKMMEKLLPGGFLIVGIHESLPEGVSGIKPWRGKRCIYQKVDP
jgi:chemotaxis protein methyltransferase CheR